MQEQTLFIGGITRDTTETELSDLLTRSLPQNLLGPGCKISRVRLIKNEKTDKNRGFAFCEGPSFLTKYLISTPVYQGSKLLDIQPAKSSYSAEELGGQSPKVKIFSEKRAFKTKQLEKGVWKLGLDVRAVQKLSPFKPQIQVHQLTFSDLRTLDKFSKVDKIEIASNTYSLIKRGDLPGIFLRELSEKPNLLSLVSYPEALDQIAHNCQKQRKSVTENRIGKKRPKAQLPQGRLSRQRTRGSFFIKSLQAINSKSPQKQGRTKGGLATNNTIKSIGDACTLCKVVRRSVLISQQVSNLRFNKNINKGRFVRESAPKFSYPLFFY